MTKQMHYGLQWQALVPKSDLTGKIFGRLTVINLSHTDGKRLYWNCLCECGNAKTVKGDYLSTNRTRSCGCLKKETTVLINKNTKRRKTSPEASAIRQLYTVYKSNAKSRGLEFSLTHEEAIALFQSPCHYTNRLPSLRVIKMGINDAEIKVPILVNGIDRLDNTKGYTVDNCVPCCTTVNLMKLNNNYEEFIKICNNIAKLHPRN